MKTNLLLAVAVLLSLAIRGRANDDTNLVRNPAFTDVGADGKPAGYTLAGDAVYRPSLLNERTDATGAGAALGDFADGAVTQTVAVDARQGRAFSFRVRGLPQDDYRVPSADGLVMKVEFFSGGGKIAYDGKLKPLFPLVQQARRDLGVNGDGRVGGAAVWRDYVLNFYLPFPQIDTVKLTLASKGASVMADQKAAAADQAPSHLKGMERRLETGGHAFLAKDFRLTRLPEPAALAAAAAPAILAGETIPLGGRWFYLARPGETKPPAQFDHANADRLLYRDGPNGQTQAPFAGNMSAVLHAGNADLAGITAAADRPVADNVTVRFERGCLVLHAHGLPNHPTGQFPEDGFGPAFNPNPIQEQDETYYLPLEPKENPAHVAYSGGGTGRALNMGPVGVAVNGVVFFNPFDAQQTDASNGMDRCCGHPNQDGQYHYHKYPICLNSPWTDEGRAHSPLIGWAFDGYPIYGPYESADVMAKDVTGAGALNAFNLHFDAQRGWHYHVTPGRFPYVLGGYWGAADRRNFHRPRGPGPQPEDDGSPPRR